VFSDAIGTESVFKGGTSLSKCFGLIERFSEDIDIVVMQSAADSGNQLKGKIKRIGAVVSRVMPEIEIAGLTHRRGMIRKTAHSYSSAYKNISEQVRGDVVVVEATWLGSYEPFTTKPLNTYIMDMMVERGQQSLVEEYGLLPFEVQVLCPERTFCEKIMSLVRFSYGDTWLDELKRKIRHIYDLHKLLSDPEIHAFFNASDFDELLLRVAQDDVISFKNNNEWLMNPPWQARVFADTSMVWRNLESVYNGDFAHLVYGVLPPEDKVFNSLSEIASRLHKIDWNITV
jgi:predicted nucleotidyltransferase component of viral defense system